MDDKKVKEIKEEEFTEEIDNAEANNEIEDLKNRVTELENQSKRILADYQNLEKRTVEEKREWIRSANKDLLLRLLPGLDMLMLAAKHVKDQGLNLSLQQFLLSLEAEGVTKIKTVGEKFNPHLMEVIQTVDGEDGNVLEEVRSGYMLYDKVLRSAQVKVGKKGEKKETN